MRNSAFLEEKSVRFGAIYAECRLSHGAQENAVPFRAETNCAFDFIKLRKFRGYIYCDVGGNLRM